MGRSQHGQHSSSLVLSLGQYFSAVLAGTEREQVGQSRKWVGVRDMVGFPRKEKDGSRVLLLRCIYGHSSLRETLITCPSSTI